MTPKLLTQTELVNRIQETMEFDVSASVVKDVLSSLEAVVFDAMENVERIKLGNIVVVEPKLRKARAARMGRNPATGEEVEIPKKPADVVVKARISKRLRESAPPVAKARRKLATNSK